MQILSIDASTKSTGWSIFNNKSLKSYGCITASSPDLIKRITTMINELYIILQENNIQKIILEEVRPEEIKIGSVNNKTYKALMYLQAAITFLIHEQYPSIDIEYLYPSEWRATCGIKTGKGVVRKELKKQDILFVKKTYNIDVNDDIADAIGIGHAYLNKEKEGINWA